MENNINKKFGFTLAAILSLIAVFNYLKHQHSITFFVISFLLFFSALALPGILSPLKKFWDILGNVLGTLNTWLLLILLYVVCIIPISAMLRIFMKDPLKLKIKKKQSTYWELCGQETEDFMKYQF